MPISTQPSSAAGLLALLSESDQAELQTYALEQLNVVVDQFWPEISEHVVAVETLSESSTLPAASRSLAALVASKIYYHLGAYDEALSFALSAGDRFEAERAAVSTGKGKASEGYVEVILTKCIDTYIAARAAGSSTEDARLESIVSSVLARCEALEEWRQALGIALEARRLDVLSRIWEKTKDDDLLRWTLEALGVGRGFSLAYRQEVLHLLLSLFQKSSSPDYFSITQVHIQLNEPALSSALVSSLVAQSSSEIAQEKDRRVVVAYQIGFDLAEGATQEYLSSVLAGLGSSQESESEVVSNLRKILSGEKTIRLYLDFLHKNNHADLLILKKTKDALEARSSMYHSAVTFANGFMNAGTTSDQFLRDNLEWLGRASNWSKFSATAALGVIHKGSLARGRTILGPYLPGAAAAGGAPASPYSEGGSLYALGLINAGRGTDVLDYLKTQLTSHSGEEIVQHGAALGLGVAGMASGNEDVYDALRETLFMDSAIAGEASGYAMGLTMLGTASPKAYEEMIQYAHETQHEKIIRGLAVGIAFLMYGKEEQADEVIAKMLAEKDAILRYGGIYTIAMAYAGTSNNQAIRKVLDVAVSDVSDDVRRAAVTALGFILFRNPTQVPRIVQLLAESYNPHVRQGAAFALGISCAGTGLEEAIELLMPMVKDPVDFVRQGALISLSMVLIQQTEAQNSSVKKVRALFSTIVADKHEDGMAKFGAALAQGILDAGGRNVTISLVSKSGSKNMSAVVGMALFTQFWYWFPLAHSLSLGFTPTAVIALDKDLKIPKMTFVSKARPSLYAYPSPVTEEKKEEVKTVKTAVLSTTAKSNARAKEKKRVEEGGDAMETDDKVKEIPAAATEDDAMKVDDDAADETTALLSSTDAATATASSSPTTSTAAAASASKKPAPEPSSETLQNMVRVTPAQATTLAFPLSARYLPVRLSSPSSLLSSSSSPSAPSSSSSSKFAPSAPAKGARGGGILLVLDQDPEATDGEYIELNPALDRVPAPAMPEAGGATVAGGPVVAPEVVEDGPERDPPASFEYPFSS